VARHLVITVRAVAADTWHHAAENHLPGMAGLRECGAHEALTDSIPRDFTMTRRRLAP
jgi:hypothetical protein